MTTATKTPYEFVFTPKVSLIEDKQSGTKRMRVEGVLSIADEVTGNGRRYGLPIWEKHIGDSESDFMKRVSERKVTGMLEHPKEDADLDRVSHLFEAIELRENGIVWGRILILNEGRGKLLRELFEVGIPVGVSSRGEGSTVLTEDGIEDVQDDYELEAWDFVHTPALEAARATPVSESQRGRRGKESGSMKDDNSKVIESAKATAQEIEGKDLSKLEAAALATLHARVLESVLGLGSLTESDAAELRGRLMALSTQVSKALAERVKTPGDKIAEEFNKEHPDGISAIFALVERLVQQNGKLAGELKTLKEGAGDPKKLEELETLKKKHTSAMKIGEELVKRVNKLMQENLQLTKKVDLAVRTFDKVMEAVRARGLDKEVAGLITRTPALRHAREALMKSKTRKQLKEKVEVFTSIIEESSGREEKPPREPLPPKDVKKGKRLREATAPGAEKKHPTLFGRMAARGM